MRACLGFTLALLLGAPAMVHAQEAMPREGDFVALDFGLPQPESKPAQRSMARRV